MKAVVELDGHVHEVTLEQADDGRWTATVDGRHYPVHVDRSGPGTVVSVGATVHVLDHIRRDTVVFDGEETRYRLLSLSGVAGADDARAATYGPIRPPMTGKVENVLVVAGQEVDAGDVLFILEAMKMRNEVRAPAAGRVRVVHVQVGAAVDPSTIVLELDPPEE